jgi:2-polyprenyl-3-methyl-5-hydroxy-6-metoxy-1,4-benzoquinol methylase
MQHDYAKQYGEFQKWHWWFRGRRQIIESVLQHKLGDKIPRTILSVGCGPSEGIEWLLPLTKGSGTILGLDADRLHALQTPPGVHFVTGLLQEAPLADSSFDVVLALDVLEHIEDDVAALRGARRLLKKNGLLVVTVPALPILWGGQDVVSQHFRRYTRRSLDTLFKAAGLANYDINYFNTLLFPMAASVRLTTRVLGLNRSDNELKYSQPGMTNNFMARIFGSERHLINRARMPIGVSLVATFTSPD